MNKFFSFALLSFASLSIQAQTITDLDNELFKVSVPDSLSTPRLLGSALTFGIISAFKSDTEKKSEDDEVWNAAMEHAEKKGCILVARPLDDRSERERRIMWSEREVNGYKSHLIETDGGRVFLIASNVEDPIYNYKYSNTFICLRKMPAHKVIATGIAKPSELMRPAK